MRRELGWRKQSGVSQLGEVKMLFKRSGEKNEGETHIFTTVTTGQAPCEEGNDGKRTIPTVGCCAREMSIIDTTTPITCGD